MQKYITKEDYSQLNAEAKSFYAVQFQEYIFIQPGSEAWVDISETKATYTTNEVQKVYKLKD